MKKFGRPNDGPGFVRNRGGDDRGFSRGGRGGYDERPTQRPFGRPDGRPNDFGARGGGAFARGGDERPARKTYRREDGQRGGYGQGRPPQDREEFRPSRPPQAAAAPQAAPRPAANVPVPAAALKAGIAQANKALGGVIEQFGSTIRGDYDISQVEVAVSFDSEGRFVGFGSGAAVSFTLTVTPLESEDVFAADEDAPSARNDRAYDLEASPFEEGASEPMEAQDASGDDLRLADDEGDDAQPQTSH